MNVFDFALYFVGSLTFVGALTFFGSLALMLLVLIFIEDVLFALIEILIATGFLFSRICLSDASQLSEQNKEDIDKRKKRFELIKKATKSE
jgi:hypothetical protein